MAQKKKIAEFCRYNDGVQCRDQTKCDTCGWQPTIAKLRKQRNRTDTEDCCEMQCDPQ